MQYIAYCTKGLEKIVKDEIEEKIIDATLEQINDKRVLFTSNSSFSDLVQLRTVDDIGILLFSEQNLSFDEIVSQIAGSDLMEIKHQLSLFRDVGIDIFSLTTSIMGNKVIRPSLLTNQLDQTITSRFGWQRDISVHTQFDIRIFIDREHVIASVRISGESLHHRPYQKNAVMGALRPTVAAAMVRLATKGNHHMKVVDDFCGSGTILAEAFLEGEDIYGGDIDAHRVVMALENLHITGFEQIDQLKQLNALKTNWKREYFDCAISNLPWNKQVEVKSLTDLYVGTLLEYQRIVKKDGVLCLLVSQPELLIKHAKDIFPFSRISSYKIGLLGQNPTIVVIERYAP